ncbi:MAG TPA: type I glyceraldehyde-3-phosphate dehydrogenase [Candidatus Wildermuthbacteria bacterium]|nr:type I glyceraldehyde-3-phosphate dehydrogenase [Candidatus Wildermuthbacteria bacterium]
MTRIAINGFGRIGRLFFRQLVEKGGFEIVAINDLGDIEQLAYLLKYDTVYGRFSEKVEIKKDSIVVGGKSIKVFSEKDPVKLPWGKLKVDVVVEATGAFRSYGSAKVHLASGAKRVVITAPSKDEDTKDSKTILVGVNDNEIDSATITSNGSCTTNAAAPVIEILRKNPGMLKAILNSSHGYTASQNLVDGSSKGEDVRRGRAAAQNIVPSSTGAAIAVARAIPELEGKFDGIALRVPVLSGSIADVTFISKRKTSVKEINSILSKAASSKRWKGILKVTEDPIVSADIIGEPYAAIVDLNLTRVVDGDLVKVLSWYDNEAGYVATLVSHLEAVAKTL